MNTRRSQDAHIDSLDVQESELAAVFDATALRPSAGQLESLAAMAARMGETDRAPSVQPAGGARRHGGLWAVAAALAAMAAGGWYVSMLQQDSRQAARGSGAVQAAPSPAAERAAPQPQLVQRQVKAEVLQPVAGWDDAESQQDDGAGALAMVDDDPLAAFDSWDDDLQGADIAE